MSLQDDIFDVEAALKRNKPAAASFNKLMRVFSELEEENEALTSQVFILKSAIKLVQGDQ